VPHLIHLNGPPGIGKSTLAQRYVDEHPGVLNLDIDRLRALIGGWRERFAETGEIVRPVALSMAATHLRGRVGRSSARFPVPGADVLILDTIGPSR
jgi:predicted kinase